MLPASRLEGVDDTLERPVFHWCTLLIIGALIGAPGCALVPSVPAGPIGGPSVRLGATGAFAYAPAKAQTVHGAGEPYTLRSNSAMFGGLLPFFPIRAMLRAAPATFLDVGADVGWMDAGLQLRAGWLDARRKLPLGLELEWRTGEGAIFNDELVHQTRIYRARGELYPKLGQWAAMDMFAVFTLGISTGTMFHFMFVPAAFDQSFEGPTHVGLGAVRPETRLEVSLGVHGKGRWNAFTVALMPWLALYEGRVTRATCDLCPLELRELSSPWGVSIVASGSFVLEGR